MATRCKFKCASVTDFGNGNREVQMSAVSDASIPENVSFTKFTPSGNLKFMLQNPAVQIAPGKDYYLDITEVES